MNEPRVGRQVLIFAGSLAATAPLAILVFFSISHAWLALIPGGLLAAVYWLCRKRVVIVAAGSWFC